MPGSGLFRGLPGSPPPPDYQLNSPEMAKTRPGSVPSKWDRQPPLGFDIPRPRDEAAGRSEIDCIRLLSPIRRVERVHEASEPRIAREFIFPSPSIALASGRWLPAAGPPWRKVRLSAAMRCRGGSCDFRRGVQGNGWDQEGVGSGQRCQKGWTDSTLGPRLVRTRASFEGRRRLGAPRDPATASARPGVPRGTMLIFILVSFRPWSAGSPRRSNEMRTFHGERRDPGGGEANA